MKTTWPELSYAEAHKTYETIHLWTQIVGKIRLVKTPWFNHSWHVTLYVTPSGFTTSDMVDGEKHFQLDFDFIRHQLRLKTSAGESHSIDLKGLSVAGCYKQLQDALRQVGIEANINPVPNELEDPIPFDQDEIHATYNPEHATALHQAFLRAHDVFSKFKARFSGKCSPVHLFWGSFDLAVSRFSGRDAPKHPGGVPNLPDWVAQEAYSKEVYSCGFWPGSEALPQAAFYSYIYPEPEGFKVARIKPKQAYYHPELREFILPYEAVQKAEDPEAMLMDFLQSTYEAAAELAKWDRRALEQEDFSERRKSDQNTYKQVDKRNKEPKD
ncbi:DUF5996 family protein [Pontibacter ramchanderi]|uniref:Ava_C0101 and related proteins n=1 Tax=Pontibacter ramchanderi TaxID=1179743 RepID=A0A2N3V2Q3_9BACT|nr:DUF5996 family protein [Pontibacter ramchanderi]PKV75907.1 hypothetical protein BD749_0855 [Pontibacter ramchanderi]